MLERKRVVYEAGPAGRPDSRRFRLELPVERDWTVIGRGRSADVIIAEPTISRAHAAIGYDGEGFFVEDLGSTNGTSVNGKREPRAPLSSGDEIRLGKLVLSVKLPSG